MFHNFKKTCKSPEFWKFFGSFLYYAHPVRKKTAKKTFYDNPQIIFFRWLLFSNDDDEQPRSVIDIEHIQSGNNQRVSSLEEANQWMKDVKENTQKESRLFENEGDLLL